MDPGFDRTLAIPCEELAEKWDKNRHDLSSFHDTDLDCWLSVQKSKFFQHYSILGMFLSFEANNFSSCIFPEIGQSSTTASRVSGAYG